MSRGTRPHRRPCRIFAGLAAILFGSIIAQGLYTDLVSGLAYSLSSRDLPAPRYGVLGHRLARNVRNQLEGLAVFLPLAVVAAELGVSNPWTQWASAVYVGARALYPFAYALGWTPYRSILWSVGFLALPVFAYGLVSGAGL